LQGGFGALAAGPLAFQPESITDMIISATYSHHWLGGFFILMLLKVLKPHYAN